MLQLIFKAICQWLRRRSALTSVMFLLLSASSLALAVEVSLPNIDPAFQILIKSDEIAKEQRGAYDVLAFSGHCQLTQGPLSGGAHEIILWIERSLPDESDQPGKIICMMQGDVRLDWGHDKTTGKIRDTRWMGRLFSLYPVNYQALRETRRFDIPNLDWKQDVSSLTTMQLAQYSKATGIVPPTAASGSNTELLPAPPLLNTIQQPSANSVPVMPSTSAIQAMPGAVPWNSTAGGAMTSPGSTIPNEGLVIPNDGSAPFSATAPSPTAELVSPPFPSQQQQVTLQPTIDTALGVRNIRFFQRNSNSTIAYRPDPATGENVLEMRGGFRLVVEGIQWQAPDGNLINLGTVSMEADNAIVWNRQNGGNPLEGLSSTPDRPIELYLDGNIVFNQGNRVIYADRMYYNVSSEYGMVLSAEMLTPAPQYQGLLRLKADVLQHNGQRNIRAFGAAFTSSRLGIPRYWLQSREVELEDQRTEENLTVLSPSDSTRTTNMQATATSNFLYVGGLPVLFWPTFRSNLANPSFYLTSARLTSDNIFGTQTGLAWDVYQLLGLRGPQGTDLTLSTEYYSSRGFALGGRFNFNRPTLFLGVPGAGFIDAWGIDDSGKDFLGLDRQNLTPEASLRGRLISRERLFLSPNVELLKEGGWVSDRNFLEQYFEQEWDQEKDLTTAIRLRRYNGNRLLDVFGQSQLNNFFTETESLPRINHSWIGQDLLSQRLTWNASTNVGYVKQNVANAPLDPVDASKFALLAWERDAEGLKSTTRHELSFPLGLNAWKVVPYVSGEAGYWKQDLNRNELTRLAGQVGLRSSLPFWRIDPNFGSSLFDINGLAHKVNLYSDIFLADANQDFELLPLYDALDDNSQEHFRRRFVFDTFGGVLPEKFDERNYAVRSGMQRWVTAGSNEIYDNTQQARFGIAQRWQTKRGLPGSERIVDLISLDLNATIFPQAQKDNFGEDVGGLNYNFRYHVGDRLTLLSDGYADVFSQGLKTVSAGAKMSRPGSGDVYIGMLSIEGPISASILSGYVNYRLNEKWIINCGTAFDFARTGTIGQTVALTRVGESALLRLGMNVDSGRDNVSFNFNIEPRFMPTRRSGQVGGEMISPAGLFGVE